MTVRWYLLSSALVALLSGCSQHHSPCPSMSGVDGCKTLGELDRSEWERFCAWQAERHGGVHRVGTCPDGPGLDYLTADECVAAIIGNPEIPADCSRRVDAFEECFELRITDPCGEWRARCNPACTECDPTCTDR